MQDKIAKNRFLNAYSALSAITPKAPFMSVKGNTYKKKQYVRLSTVVVGPEVPIYYTTNGKEPFARYENGSWIRSPGAQEYKGQAIEIKPNNKFNPTTIKALSLVHNVPSQTVSETYRIISKPKAVAKRKVKNGKSVYWTVKVKNRCSVVLAGRNAKKAKVLKKQTFKVFKKKSTKKFPFTIIFRSNKNDGTSISRKFRAKNITQKGIVATRAMPMSGEIDPDDEGDMDSLDPPTFSVNGGTYGDPVSVAINDQRGDATYYTTDGTDPETSTTRILYNGQAIQISAAGLTELKAINTWVEDGEREYSDAEEDEYEIVYPPTFSLASGTYGYDANRTVTLGALQGATYYSTDYGYTWNEYEAGAQIPVRSYTELWAYNQVDHIRKDTTSRYAISEKKMGAFGAGALSAAYENPQQWANIAPVLFPGANLTADPSGDKDLTELVDQSHIIGVQEMDAGPGWKNYNQLPGSVFMDKFNGDYVRGKVNELKADPDLINAASGSDATQINASWDSSTVNPPEAEDEEKLKITGGNCTLNGEYPYLTELRIESYGATQLLGDYPDLQYIHMNSYANLNLAGSFPSLLGVYMPGGQLLLGTDSLGFETDSANIINENGDITIYTAKDTPIVDSNIVTNGKIAVRGAGQQAPASWFHAAGSFFGAGNVITLGGLNDDNTQKFWQVPVFFSQSGISIVNCKMNWLQGCFTSRNGTMVLSGSDIDVFRGFLFAQKGIDPSQTLAKEGVYAEGGAFNLPTGLFNESYQPIGGSAGKINHVMYATMPEKFSQIQNGDAFLVALTANRYTWGADPEDCADCFDTYESPWENPYEDPEESDEEWEEEPDDYPEGWEVDMDQLTDAERAEWEANAEIEIATAQQLSDIRNNLSKNYRLTSQRT